MNGILPAVPLDTALAVGLGGGITVWLMRWAWRERHERAARTAPPRAQSRSWHCQICTAFYAAPAQERLTICPRCGSYNADEGAHA